jgi:CO/xanthine dehydrogenase Mo-binding subunit
MLMAAAALLTQNPQPSPDQVRSAISGNLCRCTGYQKVVDAVLAAAAEMRGESAAERPDAAGPGSVGRSVLMVDGVAKVLGTARYAADLQRSDMLHAAMLLSPHPHARIVQIDAARALAAEGVVSVLSARDIPGTNSHGVIVKDQPFLAEDKVRYAGEPVALVVAASERQARRACGLVRVEYETLPAVFDPHIAMAPEAELIHERGNVLSHRKIRKGDIEAGFRQADVVLERQFDTQCVDHAYLEPEAALAYWDGDTLVIECCSQGTHYHRQGVARMLDLPVSRVRVIQATTGGGFGGKIDLSVQPLAALAAYVTERPVKVVWNREESLRAGTKRHPFHMDFRLGATRDGLLTAFKAVVIGNTGAYASFGPAVLTRSATMALGPYECPNVHVDSYAVYTNTQVSGAMRGFGAPQLSPCHEPLLDEIGRSCGISPVEIRRLNLVRPGASTLTQQVLETGIGALETLERVAEEMDRERV